MPSSTIDCETTSVIDDAWIREHYSRIYRAAWLMTGDRATAEDLAQETFVVAIRGRSRFRGQSSEATWLYGILVRLQKKHWRSLARWKRRLLAYVETGERDLSAVTSGDDPRTVLATQQWRESIWADVARLPLEQRLAVTLRFAEGMSYDEIAKAVDCASGTAKSRVHHGLKRLRQTLSSDIREQFRPLEQASLSCTEEAVPASNPDSQEGGRCEIYHERNHNGSESREGQDATAPCPVELAISIARKP